MQNGRTVGISLVVSIFLFSVRGLADVGNYLEFDGSNDYISCGNPASLQISGDLTIEAWIYCESVTGNGNVIVSRALESETEAGNILYQLRILTDRSLRLMWESGSGDNRSVTTSAAAISLNTWQHVAAVRSVEATSTVYIYVNGSCVKTGSSVTNPSGGTDANQRVWIGANYQDGDYRYWFDGRIDELRIWNRVVIANDIKRNMFEILEGDEEGLAAYWRFNEEDGACAYDETHYANDGSISGAIRQRGCLDIGGDEELYLSNNTIWYADTVRARGTVVVKNGVTLTIPPGTYAEFRMSHIANRGMLKVLGNVQAVGSPVDSIIFISDYRYGQPRYWQGIRFENTLGSNDSSRFAYCVIRDGSANGKLDDYHYDENYANGGAFYIYGFSKVLIDHCTICDNRCKLLPEKYLSALYGHGGGIYCRNASPVIRNSVIENNESFFGNGGGIECYHASPIIQNNLIRNNRSAYGYDDDWYEYAGFGKGGGIHLCGSSSLIENNDICYNRAFRGGGVSVEESSPALQKNRILSNGSYQEGGGIAIYGNGSTPLIENNVISQNETESAQSWHMTYGGGIFLTGAGATICNNRISSNQADNRHGIFNGYGGGVCIVNTTRTIQLVNNLMESNIASNTYSYLACGGGMYLHRVPNINILNCTIADNYCNSTGGGIYIKDAMGLSMRNSIVWSNTGHQYADIYSDSLTGPLDVRFSNLQDGISGSGNICSDPKFVGRGPNPYSLNPTSPCINAGDSLSTELPAVDIAGNPRIFDGVVDIVDMGAYEFQGDPPPGWIPTDIDQSVPAPQLPRAFRLGKNYPNPFNATTIIPYELPQDEFVTLNIYNINAEQIDVLVDQKQPAGYYSVQWQPGQRSSGVYIYHIRAGEFHEWGRCLLLK